MASLPARLPSWLPRFPGRSLAALRLGACLLACAAGALAEDVVILANGQRINGVIDDTEQGARQDQVTIKTEQGILRLRRDLVVGVEQSYESRRAKVADGDSAALLALARWCLTKGMKDRAFELASLASRVDGAGAAVFLMRAQLTDELEGPEQALPWYQRFGKAGGTDGEGLARLKQLEDFKNGTVNGAPAAAQPPPAVVATNDGLEAKAWEPESPQWSNAVEAKMVTITSDQISNRVLQLGYSGGDKDKVAIRKSLRGMAVTDNAVLSLWASNPEKVPVRLALGVKTGNYVFYESVLKTIPPGQEWHELRFDLKGSDFKSEATKWLNTGMVGDLNDIKELQVLLYNGNTSGTLLLDGIDFQTPTKGL